MSQLEQMSIQKPPSVKAMMKATELAMETEKPICLDYYIASCNKLCKIARNGADGDKFLFKGQEEYTSPLKTMYKIADDSTNDVDDYILETQNSIYIISGLMLT